MIEMGKPQREDAIAQEIRAFEDKEKEKSPDIERGASPYWAVVILLVGLALAIYLL